MPKCSSKSKAQGTFTNIMACYAHRNTDLLTLLMCLSDAIFQDWRKVMLHWIQMVPKGHLPPVWTWHWCIWQCKNTWSTWICFLGLKWKFWNTVYNPRPQPRQCRIQNWFVWGFRAPVSVLFTHVITSMLKERVSFHWVHDVHQLVCWNWGKHVSMTVFFHFMTHNPGTFYLLKRRARRHLPKICVHCFRLADPCPPVARMWLLAPST